MRNTMVVFSMAFLLVVRLAGAEERDVKAVHPFYVEMAASFNSAVSGVPEFILKNPSTSRTLKIHGKAGAVKLTVDKDTDLKPFVGHWNGTVKYDSGKYDIFSIKIVDPENREFSIAPSLKADALNGELTNTYDGDRGQHYTEQGYFAMAQHIYYYGRATAYREIFISRDDHTHEDPKAAISSWKKLGAGSYAPLHNLNTFAGTHPDGTFFHSTSTFMSHFAGVSGNGVETSADLNGKTGYLETYVGLAKGLGPIKAEVTIDDKIVYVNDKIIGLERITVPFTKAKKGSVRITVASGGAATEFRIGATTWWAYEDATRYRDKQLIPPKSKAVLYGDSWGVFYNSAICRELERLLKHDGSQIINSSVGGQTAAWAIKNFDEKVLAHKPDILIIEFFTNDHNQYDFKTWKANITRLCEMAVSNGITPIVILPAATASVNQAQEHLWWGADFCRINDRDKPDH